MAEFEPAVAVVLEHEGGFVNDDRDAGGPTKYGISLRWLTRSHLDLNKDGTVDQGDIVWLTLPEAKRLYRVYFWDPGGYYRFAHQLLATKVFDIAVHAGAFVAHTLLQRAERLCGHPVTVDGLCGPLTVQAATQSPPDSLLGFLCCEQGRFYRGLIKQHPSYSAFRVAWLTRARWPMAPDTKEREEGQTA